MKKILLSLMAVAALSANAQEKKIVGVELFNIVDGVETSSGMSSTNYYDKENANTLQMTAYSKILLTYNAQGLRATQTSYSWDASAGWTTSAYNQIAYEYDAEGNNTAYVDGNGSTYSFSGYENGYYTTMTTPYYQASYKNYFNEKKQIVQRDVLSQDGATVSQRTVYTYNADGALATEATGYVNEDTIVTSSNYSASEYTYNADGTINYIITNSITRYGENTTKMLYIYAEYSAAYVPQNVKATAGANNTISVTWDAVVGATAYKVIYDQTVADVEGTTLTTGSLIDGEHQFYVQAVINGVARNISDVATASVKDTGKLPAENFEVLGVEQGEDEWGGVCYNVKIKFTLPTTTSTITDYSLSYGDGSWDKTSITDPTVDGSTVTATVSLSQYSIGQYNSETYEYDLRTDVPLSVIITYATGNADKSNVVVYDFVENKVNTAVVAPTASALSATYYSVSGAKSAAAQRGINIVKMSDGSVKKVLVK